MTFDRTSALSSREYHLAFYRPLRSEYNSTELSCASKLYCCNGYKYLFSLESNYCPSRALAEIIVCDVSYDTVAFLLEIACDAELKREFEAVNNEALFRPQMRAYFFHSWYENRESSLKSVSEVT